MRVMTISASEDQTKERPASLEERQGVLEYVFTGSTLRRSLTIAAVVGCVLSITNQYDVLARGELNARLWVKLFLNFLIPFTVASVSAAANRRR